MGGFRQRVDARFGDAGHSGQRPLDGLGAVGTGHAFDVEDDCSHIRHAVKVVAVGGCVEWAELDADKQGGDNGLMPEPIRREYWE